MISSVLHGIWRWCPLHRLIEKVALSASSRKRSPMIEDNFGASRQGLSRYGASREGESTLLPMLIAGLVTVVVGIAVAAFFV